MSVLRGVLPTIPSFRTEGGVVYYEVRSGGAPVWKRFSEFVQLQRELAAACGLVADKTLFGWRRAAWFRQSPEARRPQLQLFLCDAASSLKTKTSSVTTRELPEGQRRARAVLDTFTGHGPAGQGCSLFADVMCSVGSSVCAAGAAEADDGVPGGGAADVTLTVNEMGGRQFELRLSGSSNVSEVKVQLQRAGAAPVGQQDLFVGGVEDKCRDDAVVSQLLPDGGVPRVLFLLVRPDDRYVQTTGPGESQPNDFEFDEVVPSEAMKTIKLLFLGESGVGKTALLLRAVDDSFARTFIRGIGNDFKVVNTLWHEQPLKLWMIESVAVGTQTSAYPWQGILLVFDVSSRFSFEYLRTTLLVEVNQYAPSTCKRVLVASKCDLDLKQHGDECDTGVRQIRAVSHEEALQFAHENDMDYFETSAKDGIGIRESLFALTRQVLAPAPAALDGGQLA